jgi:hypothetical protein
MRILGADLGLLEEEQCRVESDNDSIALFRILDQGRLRFNISACMLPHLALRTLELAFRPCLPYRVYNHAKHDFAL